MKTTVLATCVLLGSAVAAPKSGPGVNQFHRRDNLQQVTMTVVNKMSSPISTSIVSNAGASTLISGAATLVGTMSSQATATLVAPLGWSGNVAVVDDDVEILGNNSTSLLEFGLTVQGGENKLDVDASYV